MEREELREEIARKIVEILLDDDFEVVELSGTMACEIADLLASPILALFPEWAKANGYESTKETEARSYTQGVLDGRKGYVRLAEDKEGLLPTDDELQKLIDISPEIYRCGIFQTADDLKKLLKSQISKVLNKERERLLNYLKGLLAVNPKASLASTIDLIESTKSTDKGE
jgi:hypothetical protein